MGDTKNIISLCTGYGGIELGIKLSGERVRTVLACEIETHAIANLVAKMESGSLESFPVWTDIRTLDSRPFSGKVDGIIGGYPCQPFSCAGLRKGGKDPRHLWPYILKHIRTVRPVWCFFENVAGHLNLGFEEVLSSLIGLGYQVEAGLFTASEVGAPHKRQRLFILAYSRCVGQAVCQEYATRAQQSSELADSTVRGGRGELRELHEADAGFGQSKEQHQEQCRESVDAGELVDTDRDGHSRHSVASDTEPERRTETSVDADGQLADSRGVHGEGPHSNGDDSAGICQSARRCPLRCEDSRCSSGCRGLGDPESGRSGERCDSRCEGKGFRASRSGGGRGCQLAESCSQRPQGCRSERHDLASLGLLDGKGRVVHRWPARPGHEQFEWEEPRTVMSQRDYNMLKIYIEKYQTSLTKGQAKALAYAENKYDAQSPLGLSTDGVATRVDMLRLLGNGVVPQQVLRAWRVLWKIMSDNWN